MKLKINKVLKFVSNDDPDYYVNININIQTNQTEQKFLSHIDDILTSIKFNGLKSLNQHNEEKKINKQIEKQQEDYIKKLNKEKEQLQKKQKAEQEKLQKEKDKLIKKFQ